MFCKTVLVSFFILISITNLTIADTASDLKQIDTLISNGQYSQPEQLCASIIQSNAGTNSALIAKGKLIVIYIKTNRLPQADTEITKLLSDYTSNSELPAVLYGILLRFKSTGEIQRAENLSQQITQQFPDSEYTQRIQLDSVKERILKLIIEGKISEAQTQVNTMVSNSPNNIAVPDTLLRIAREFKEAGGNDESISVYQKIIQNYPNSGRVNKARLGIDKLVIWNYIKAGDVNNALNNLELLITNYSSEEKLPHIITGIALRFEEKEFYQQAKSLYQRVLDNYPADRAAEIAAVDIVKCDIRSNINSADSNFAQIMQQLNSFKTAFAERWQLPEAIFQIGQEYYNRAMKLESDGSIPQAKEYYRNAASVWDIVINQFTNSFLIAEACDYSGTCYEKTGDYIKANQCYLKGIEAHKGYRMRWKMIFMSGRNYEKMKRLKIIAESEADLQIRTMYEKLLAEYPDCKAAVYAHKWLAQ